MNYFLLFDLFKISVPASSSLKFQTVIPPSLEDEINQIYIYVYFFIISIII